MIDKHIRDGAKKILSLTRTKIRLAREAETIECIPAPLPLVKILSGTNISTVEEASSYRDKLAIDIDCSNEESLASSVLQCMDIIEGVKHKYEPKEYCSNLSICDLKSMEGKNVNILLMSGSVVQRYQTIVPNSVNLYFGEKPEPKGSIYVSGVPTSIASFLAYAFNSKYFSSGKTLRNISASFGKKTLINNAIFFSIGFYGADLLSCDK